MERAILIAMARHADLLELRRLNQELRTAMTEIKTLRKLLPICSYCKKNRDQEGLWYQLEEYNSANSDVTFSHGLCPECLRRHYPEFSSDRV